MPGNTNIDHSRRNAVPANSAPRAITRGAGSPADDGANRRVATPVSLRNQLALLIAPDCPYAQRLAQAAAAGLDPEAEQVRQRLQKTLEVLRGVLESPPDDALPLDNPERLSRRLRQHTAGRDHALDVVLAGALLTELNVQDADHDVGVDALDAYERAPDAYDLLLGDLLPETLQGCQHREAERAAFLSGTSPTVRQDQHEYRRRRAWRRAHPPQGLATGMSALDKRSPGLRRLTVLAGQAHLGRADFALAMVSGAMAAEPKLGAVLFTGSSKDAVFDRFVAVAGGVGLRRLLAADLTHAERQAIRRAEAHLAEQVWGRLRVVGDLHPLDVRDWTGLIAREVQGLAQGANTSQELVIIDPLGLLPAPPGLAPAAADLERLRLLQMVQMGSRSPGMLGDGDAILALADPAVVLDRPVVPHAPGGGYLSGPPWDTLLMLEPRGRASGGVVPVQIRVAQARGLFGPEPVPLLYESDRCRFQEVDEVSPRPGNQARGGRRRGQT